MSRPAPLDGRVVVDFSQLLPDNDVSAAPVRTPVDCCEDAGQRGGWAGDLLSFPARLTGTTR